MQHPRAVHILLRISIASVFLYAAIAATITPDNWIGYIPEFARHIFPASLFLAGFSLFQVILSIWILSGWKTMYAAGVAAVTLLGIIAANWQQVDILFRDFAIFFAAVALAISDLKKIKK